MTCTRTQHSELMAFKNTVDLFVFENTVDQDQWLLMKLHLYLIRIHTVFHSACKYMLITGML